MMVRPESNEVAAALNTMDQNVAAQSAKVADAKKAGVDGLIIVDLPPEEDVELCLPALKAGLNFIRLATPTTDDRRLLTTLAAQAAPAQTCSEAVLASVPAHEVQRESWTDSGDISEMLQSFDDAEPRARAMLERDVNNLRATLGRFAPELLATASGQFYAYRTRGQLILDDRQPCESGLH